LILKGNLKFANKTEEIIAKEGSIVYFEEAELHKIAEVSQKVTMLLIKKVGATKS
jgi:quercetin dioxygenase-like cupin family protein